MAITPRLNLRQAQTLVMTPQLQQAIKLLQLNNFELAEYVEGELEQNPLLEKREAERTNNAEDGSPTTSDGESAHESATSLDQIAREGKVEDTPLDVDMREAMNADEPAAGDTGSDLYLRTKSGRNDFDSEEFDFEQSTSKDETLQDHLRAQLGLDIGDMVDRMIGVQLIDLVNEAGYVVGELEAVADSVGTTVERVEGTLSRLQRFDPPGVFARTLAECLAIQLKERDRLDPAMQAMLGRLDLLARNDIGALCKICSQSREDVLDMIAEIKTLNPKPGLAFGSDLAQTVVPDVFVRPRPHGGWLVELNADTLPSVLVNTRYYARISSSANSEADKSYLSEKLRSANWLVKSLDQRANTILKVATEIVAQQEAFLAHGVAHLRPLNLRDIATAISMHESTVSRVTANKHMTTPRGIFLMKYFFTSAIASADGASMHSAESVRARIRQLIDHETPDQILSDDRIVEILRGVDIDIARRTVAKYREAMRIPSSVDRRRLKKAIA
jgi:RNA polymerase sigma-54 factor